MTTLNPYDQDNVLNRLPKRVFDALKVAEGRLVLAGGYIRDTVIHEKPNDIDLFSCSKEFAMNIANTMGHPGQRTHTTDNAITFIGAEPALQIITRWTYAKPEMVVPSFDFTIAQAAIWFDGQNWQSLCADTFYSDLAARRLVYTNPVREEEAGGSLLRLLKFHRRGYSAPLKTTADILSRMFVSVPMSSLRKTETMDEQVWQEQLGTVLTGLLREVDPCIDPLKLH